METERQKDAREAAEARKAREAGRVPRLNKVQIKRWIVRIAVLLAALLLAGATVFAFVIYPEIPYSIDYSSGCDMEGYVGALLYELDEVQEEAEKTVRFDSFLTTTVAVITLQEPVEETVEEMQRRLIDEFPLRLTYTVHTYCTDFYIDDDTGELVTESVRVMISPWTHGVWPKMPDLYWKYKRLKHDYPERDMPDLSNVISVYVQSDSGRYEFLIFSNRRGDLEELLERCVEEANAMIAEQAGG